MTYDFIDYKLAKDWQGSETIPAKPGIYAVFLKTTDHVPEDWRDDLKRPDHLLYIGRSADVKGRLKEHFSGSSSARSTLRRSIGAMMIDVLPLGHCYYTSDAAKNFRFENEKPLSLWIQENCLYNFRINHDAYHDETAFIKNFKPLFIRK